MIDTKTCSSHQMHECHEMGVELESEYLESEYHATSTSWVVFRKSLLASVYLSVNEKSLLEQHYSLFNKYKQLDPLKFPNRLNCLNTMKSKQCNNF